MNKNSSLSLFFRSKQVLILGLLFALSGAAGLILQVVWMYRLALVFGNAAYATAATLAAFFFGLAIGGWFWGGIAHRFRHPLTVYGFMEIGIALGALMLIPGLDLYEYYYSNLVNISGGNGQAMTVIKFLFSTLLLFVPTVLMGGTFPILAQFVGGQRQKTANRTTLLYALNTLGASLGAFFAGFYLLSNYGVHATYLFAVVLAIGVGCLAIVLSRLISPNPGNIDEEKNRSSFQKQVTSKKLSLALNYRQFVTIAFASGLLAISAETIWTRMFAQVLQNSVYSFSAILVVFLLALGTGGLIANLLVRMARPTVSILVILLSISALLIGFSIIIFESKTDGLAYLSPEIPWPAYLRAVFGLSFSVVFIPTMTLGAIFPFLLKSYSEIGLSAGKFVGRLVLFNSIGSTIGPIVAGFILLDAVGFWVSLKIIGICYSAVGFYLVYSFYDQKKWHWIAITLVPVFVLIALTNPPTVRLNTGDELLDLRQSSDGVVSIVRSGGNLEMRLDNFYVLGDSRSVLVEQMQGHIPHLIHPDPNRSLFLGIGTGITAGAALSYEVEEVVAVELVRNVLPVAEKYFSTWTNGLFGDPRVNLVTDDARNYLLGSSDSFDVIVGDLFTPWHAGTGSLYTLEHFEQVKSHLAEGGVFAQWLPLFQLTPEGFDVIAATFASVFPEVTVWRADFSSSRGSIALIGQDKGARLSHDVLLKNSSVLFGGSESTEKDKPNHMTGLFYLGNLKALKDQLSKVTINDDDKRTIEFGSPIYAQSANAGEGAFLTGAALDKLLITLAVGIPAEEDAYLSDLPADELRFVEIGLKYYQYQQMIANGRTKEAQKIAKEIQAIAPDFLNDNRK